MKLASEQPEFIPYIGFFQKMYYADVFVLMDDVKFQGKSSYQRRNRIIKEDGANYWLTLPIPSGTRNLMIKDVQLGQWQEKNYKRVFRELAPIFGERKIKSIFDKENLLEINSSLIKEIAAILEIDTKIILSSELNVYSSKQERLIEYCRKLGATEYVSGQGARLGYLEDYPWPTDEIKLSYFEPFFESYSSIICYLKDSKGVEKAKYLISESSNLMLSK